MERIKKVLGTEMPKKTAFQYASIIIALVFVGQFPDIQHSLGTIAVEARDNIAGVVGMAVAVPPNEVNLLAQSLEERKVELDQRERDIDAKEREIRAVVLEETAKQNRITLLVIGAVTLLFAVLIGVNFYLDRKRNKAEGGGVKIGTHAHEGEFTTKL